MKRFLILAATAFLLSGCLAHTVVIEGHHHGTTPPPWHFKEHHVIHDGHGHHRAHHHYTNKHGWKSHRPYYNPCNC